MDYAIGNWECKCGNLKGLHHLRTTCRNCGATVITDPFHPGDVLCHKCGTYNANTPDFCNKCGDPVGLQLKYDVNECEERGMTYSAPLKVTMRLTIYDKDPETGNQDHSRHQGTGSFLRRHSADDRERHVHHQRHRARHRQPVAPFAWRVFRDAPTTAPISWERSFRTADRGWSSSTTTKNILYVRIDRKRKFLGTIFLRALGLQSDEDILRTFYTVDRIALRDKKLYWTSRPGIENRRTCWA